MLQIYTGEDLSNVRKNEKVPYLTFEINKKGAHLTFEKIPKNPFNAILPENYII